MQQDLSYFNNNETDRNFSRASWGEKGVKMTTEPKPDPRETECFVYSFSWRVIVRGFLSFLCLFIIRACGEQQQQTKFVGLKLLAHVFPWFMNSLRLHYSFKAGSLCEAVCNSANVEAFVIVCEVIHKQIQSILVNFQANLVKFELETRVWWASRGRKIN